MRKATFVRTETITVDIIGAKNVDKDQLSDWANTGLDGGPPFDYLREAFPASVLASGISQWQCVEMQEGGEHGTSETDGTGAAETRGSAG